jgi:hypothetical protein
MTATTTANGFVPLSIKDCSSCLFQVSPDIPAEDALDRASLLLAAAKDMAQEYINLDLGNDTWGLVFLIDTAKAVVDSVNDGIRFAEDSKPMTEE